MQTKRYCPCRIKHQRSSQSVSTDPAQVKNVIDVISDIAEQTIFACPYAAIEAARAGGMTRVSVVADEYEN